MHNTFNVEADAAAAGLMSHDFCSNIWIVLSELVVNNMNAWFHPALWESVHAAGGGAANKFVATA